MEVKLGYWIVESVQLIVDVETTNIVAAENYFQWRYTMVNGWKKLDVCQVEPRSRRGRKKRKVLEKKSSANDMI